MTSGVDRWYQQIPIRTKVLLISLAVVVVVMATAGVLMVLLLRNELIGAADDLGEDTAQEIAAIAKDGTLPAVLPTAGEEAPAIQVVQSGRVISQSSDDRGRRLLPVPEQRPGTVRFSRTGGLADH